MLRGKFTFEESCQVLIAAGRIRDTIDRELGDLFARLALGEDSVIPAIHDRLNIIGHFDHADRLLKLLRKD